MSAADIIREIDRLPIAERRKVQAYLLHQRRNEDSGRAEDLARRIDDARAGRALTSAEVRSLVAAAGGR